MEFLPYEINLPDEIKMQIFLFVGNPNPKLMHDIKNFVRLYEIYSSLKQIHHPSFAFFSRLQPLERCHLIVSSEENFCRSYVQEYPSFRIYEMEHLYGI